MSGWQNSGRRDRLPPDWAKLRKRVLRRDGWMCQWKLEDGRKCLRDANEVDHRRPGDDHSEANLRALCTWHHARKSAGEGARASAAKRKAIDMRFVRTEEHPGLL